MSATGKTANYDLAIYNPTDTTTWDDFNSNMGKIDTAIKAASDSSGVEIPGQVEFIASLDPTLGTPLQVVPSSENVRIDYTTTTSESGFTIGNSQSIEISSVNSTNAGVMTPEMLQKLNSVGGGGISPKIVAEKTFSNIMQSMSYSLTPISGSVFEKSHLYIGCFTITVNGAALENGEYSTIYLPTSFTTTNLVAFSKINNNTFSQTFTYAFIAEDDSNYYSISTVPDTKGIIEIDAKVIQI